MCKNISTRANIFVFAQQTQVYFVFSHFVINTYNILFIPGSYTNCNIHIIPILSIAEGPALFSHYNCLGTTDHPYITIKFLPGLFFMCPGRDKWQFGPKMWEWDIVLHKCLTVHRVDFRSGRRYRLID
jgi:hypothetical protein